MDLEQRDLEPVGLSGIGAAGAGITRVGRPVGRATRSVGRSSERRAAGLAALDLAPPLLGHVGDAMGELRGVGDQRLGAEQGSGLRLGQPPGEELREGHVQPAHVAGAGVDQAVRLRRPEDRDLALADRQALPAEEVVEPSVQDDVDLHVVVAVHREHRRRGAAPHPQPRRHLLDPLVDPSLAHALNGSAAATSQSEGSWNSRPGFRETSGPVRP